MKKTCIKEGRWISEETFEEVVGPKYGEEVIVTEAEEYPDGLYYFLDGYPEDQAYHSKHFVDSIEIEAILEEIEELENIEG